MSASLVGSEMCIRDSYPDAPRPPFWRPRWAPRRVKNSKAAALLPRLRNCLLYTSDAADDM
eukprot:12074294-Alexandrium_andersonii.AAC.1